jgi:hypothetical protein
MTAQVDRFIAKNREFERAIARAEKAAGGGLREAAKARSGLQRRVSQALANDGSRGRGHAADGAVAVRTRRKITDPEVLERRRAALDRARAARAAKRAAGAG